MLFADSNIVCIHICSSWQALQQYISLSMTNLFNFMLIHVAHMHYFSHYSISPPYQLRASCSHTPVVLVHLAR
jgi:hypothetical protein